MVYIHMIMVSYSQVRLGLGRQERLGGLVWVRLGYPSVAYKILPNGRLGNKHSITNLKVHDIFEKISLKVLIRLNLPKEMSFSGTN